MKREYLTTDFVFYSVFENQIYDLYFFLNDPKWNEDILRDTSFRFSNIRPPQKKDGKWRILMNFDDYGYSFRQKQADADREVDFLLNHNPVNLILSSKFSNIESRKQVRVSCREVV